ncbi:MAG: 16S rRNA (uracil(1498)-N(3))-methyltransferase [Paracoccaceae bacterium]|nr:16S rRNA (uracil(1498)-N(3))-methyltransferase [Paracoccaceae bacterium]
MTFKIRLYVDHLLGADQTVLLNREQSHYLFLVMRQKLGAQLALFNGYDGEWRAQVTEASKRSGVLRCIEKTRALQKPPDLWLFFAPIKKVRTDFIVEKAAELGVAQIFPVQTDFTNSERIKQERLQTHAIEASEQCGGTFVPKVHGLQKLHQVLSDWPGGRRLMFCDEATAGEGRMLANAAAGPWAILIGPEGGFSKPERKRLNALTQSHAVSLGPRILRADTAVVAAITLWQAFLGDWK